MERNYVLFIFNNSKDEFLKEPKELKILQQVTVGDIRGASCGPINMCFFPSEHSKEEISDLLVKDGIHFLLVDDQDSEHSYPKHIRSMLSGKMDHTAVRKIEIGGGMEITEPKKLSLEDQLKEALKEDDFELAAVLRDKIAKAKSPEPKTGKGSTLRQLFD